MAWGYWVAGVAAALVLWLLLFTADLLVQEWQIWREKRGQRRRMALMRRWAYAAKHSTEGDTVRLPVATLRGSS